MTLDALLCRRLLASSSRSNKEPSWSLLQLPLPLSHLANSWAITCAQEPSLDLPTASFIIMSASTDPPPFLPQFPLAPPCAAPGIYLADGKIQHSFLGALFQH